MQLTFYFDQTRCICCYTCVVACKDWHDVPAGPASWRRVLTMERGKCPDTFVAFLSTACYHCSDPSCVSACPVNAIRKRAEDGIVVVDREACLGNDNCNLCLQVCRYDAPQFGAEDNGKMQKCDFCLERWLEGRKPVCVMACPMEALDAGPLEELRTRYGEVRESTGFTYSAKDSPSAIFQPK